MTSELFGNLAIIGLFLALFNAIVARNRLGGVIVKDIKLSALLVAACYDFPRRWYGQKLLSLRSLLASLAFFSLAFLSSYAWAILSSSADVSAYVFGYIDSLRDARFGDNVYVLGCALLSFLSQLQTRWLMGFMRDTLSIYVSLLILVVDFLLSIGIFVVLHSAVVTLAAAALICSNLDICSWELVKLYENSFYITWSYLTAQIDVSYPPYLGGSVLWIIDGENIVGFNMPFSTALSASMISSVWIWMSFAGLAISKIIWWEKSISRVFVRVPFVFVTMFFVLFFALFSFT